MTHIYTLIKTKLTNWLLAEELARLRVEQRRFESLNEERAKRVREAKYSDLMVQRLNGYDPKLLDSNDDILVRYTDGDAEMSFLEECKRLNESQPLKDIINTLVRDQVLFGVKEAESVEQLNFARSTINAFSILQDELQRLNAIYLVRTGGIEDYDKHSIT